MTIETKTAITIVWTWVFTYLWLSWETLCLFLILMIIDTLLRYIGWHVHKDFNSKKARVWILSKTTLLLIPIWFAVMFKILWIENIDIKIFDIKPTQLVSWLIGVLAIAEMYSIVKNYIYIRTGEKPSEYDAVTIILKKVLEKLQKVIEKFVSN